MLVWVPTLMLVGAAVALVAYSRSLAGWAGVLVLAAFVVTLAGQLVGKWLEVRVTERPKERIKQQEVNAAQREELLRTRCLLIDRVDRADPLQLGVHRVAGARQDPLPPYVPRDRDADVRGALLLGRFVVLEGPSASGKSRAGFEAIRGEVPGWRLLKPDSGATLRGLLRHRFDLTRTVLWLDDLQNYLGPGELDGMLVDKLCAAGTDGTILLATLNAGARQDLDHADLAAADPERLRLINTSAEVLRKAVIIPLDARLSAAERERAHGLRADARIADALDRAGEAGFTEHLAAAPAALEKWRAGRRRAHPVGAALVAAAVDCRRAGLRGGIPAEVLRRLCPLYLDARLAGRVTEEQFTDGFRWATDFVLGATSLLLPDTGDRYGVFDYLVDQVQRDPAAPSIPVAAWAMIADDANSLRDLTNLAVAAHHAGQWAVAEEVLRRAVGIPDEADPQSQFNLGVLLHQRGDIEEAEYWYRQAVEHGVAAVVGREAKRDRLTGLANADAAYTLLAELLVGPDAENVALLLCDLDSFKRINDAIGHNNGDSVLVELSRRLQAGLPAGCVAARYGGDEFLVICADVVAAGGIATLAETVSRLISGPVQVAEHTIELTVSIGVAVNRHGTAGPDDLSRIADAAVHTAKRHGRARIQIDDADLLGSLSQHVALESRLREAIGNDELVVFFEPVVDAHGVVIAAEALVHWPHPERGLLPLTGLDEYRHTQRLGGILRRLDGWALRAAMREAVTWPVSATGHKVRLMIKLTGLRLDDHALGAIVAKAVTEYGFDQSRIVLEASEDALTGLPRSTAGTWPISLGGMGVAVDDFGVGSASLVNLRDLPVHMVKLAKRFVTGMMTDATDLAIVRAVTDVAHSVSAITVAQGVQGKEQLEQLVHIGVDLYQGPIISPPLSAEHLRATLVRGDRLGPTHG